MSEDINYSPSKEEREAYYLGYTSVDYGCMKTDMFPMNPYDDLWFPRSEYLLWEAWEIGFNDGFNDKVSMIHTIESLTDD
jgi:hypothetical protein